MNGHSPKKSANFNTRPLNTYQNRRRKRSLDDQNFDNTFHCVPNVDKVPDKVDLIVDSTVNIVKWTIEESVFNETGKKLSDWELEKLARILYGQAGLEWNKPISDRDAKNLLKEARGVGKVWYSSSYQAVDTFYKENKLTEGSSKKRRKSSVVNPKSSHKRLPLKNLPNNNNNNESDYFDFQQIPEASEFEYNNISENIVCEQFPGFDTNFSERLDYEGTMSDYKEDQSYHHITNGDSMPDYNVATLLNMGNTCFMNSVLYTLRFAPTFLHNLHHLLVDLSLINSKLKENKTKTSSLGRNGSAVSGSSWRSASSKDLLSIGNNDIIPKSKDQIVTEKLHALFVTMNNLETKGSPDPYQPEALLQAMRDANTLFEGNQQQDAHEFFVELLSCLRVTCDKLNEQIEQNPDLIKSPEPTAANINNNSKIWGVRRSWKKPLKKKEKSASKKNGDFENDVAGGDSEDNLSSDGNSDSVKKKFGYNFIAEDFQGVSLHRTQCLQCEEVSELKEPFLEIQVPINYRDEDFESRVDSAIFGAICVTSEKLCDQNKYFCEICMRYNEAERTVLYEKLPNIMVLHLKRFTTSMSGVQKVNTFVPTPLEIPCFCENCNKIEKTKTTPHKYQLSCVIMHLGASMASGHYIAYSRASVETYDYIECTRDIPKSYLSSSSKDLSVNILKFFKGKGLGNTLSENQNGVGLNSKKNDAHVCQSLNCCGIRCKLNLGSPSHNDDWLEFDDEKVKILSNKEFTDMLNRRHDSTNTPYLLFYSKVEYDIKRYYKPSKLIQMPANKTNY